MAERKSGPVKPPVIDLTAQKSASSSATQSGAAKTETTAASADPKGAARPSKPAADTTAKPKTSSPKSNIVAIAATAMVGGAILGGGLAYGLASFGYWPEKPATSVQPASTEQLDALTQIVTAQQSRQETLKTELEKSVTGLENNLTKRLNSLDERLGALEADTGSAPVDLAPLNSALSDLQSRMDLLSVSSADGESVPVETVLALQDKVTQLADQLSTLATTSSAETEALRADLSALAQDVQSSATAENQNQTDVQLSLALSGLTTALTNGRPYENELRLLSTILPELTVPQNVAAHAQTGMMAPADLMVAFSRVVPDMLAATPVDAGASWQDKIMQRVKAIIALRPSGPVEGDTPDAILSRVEAALSRQDFASAADLFDALPEPMRLLASDLRNSIELLAEGQAFVRSATQGAAL